MLLVAGFGRRKRGDGGGDRPPVAVDQQIVETRFVPRFLAQTDRLGDPRQSRFARLGNERARFHRDAVV